MGCKSKKRIKRNSTNFFPFNRVKNQFSHFGGLIKNLKQNFIVEFSFWRLFFEVKGRYRHFFSPFLSSLWLFEKEFLSRSRPNSPIFFLIGLIKIYLIGSIVTVFENHKKCHITPPLYQAWGGPHAWYSGPFSLCHPVGQEQEGCVRACGLLLLFQSLSPWRAGAGGGAVWEPVGPSFPPRLGLGGGGGQCWVHGSVKPEKRT